MKLLLLSVLLLVPSAYQDLGVSCQQSKEQVSNMAYWEERALFELSQEDWRKAFKSMFNALHEIPNQCPHKPRVLTKIAHLYFYFNKSFGDSEGYYKKALQQDPYYLPAILGLGDLEFSRQDHVKALHHYQQAARWHPKLAEPLIALGEVYYHMAEPHLAINAWEGALKISPQDAATWNNLGNVFFDFKNFADAKRAYEKALDIDPTFYTAYNNLGNVHLELKDPRQAKVALEQAISLFYEDPAAHANLANAYFDLRQVERAKYHLRLSLRYQSSAVSHNNLAVMEKFTREDLNAGIHYAKALKINPSYSSARKNARFFRRRNRDLEKVLSDESEKVRQGLESVKGSVQSGRRFAIDENRSAFWTPKLR